MKGVSLSLFLCAAMLNLSIATEPYGLDQLQPFPAYLGGVFPPLAPSSNATFAAAIAFPSLSISGMMFLTPYPNSNYLVMVTKAGRIYRFESRANVANADLQTFLDISGSVFTRSDSGMTGLVFHPQFGVAGNPNRGYVYVTYKWRPTGTANADYGYIRLSRFTVADGATVATPASEQILLQEFDRQMFHDAGCMMFGADGYLYFSIGDEGGGNDEYNVTQVINARLHSGIFRIDVDKVATRSHAIRRQPLDTGAPANAVLPTGWPASFTQNYFIPNDNPFVNPDGSVLEEYYALGFRQPYRFSRDPVTGKVWIGDSGQSTREEIDFLHPGANYGWAFREGTVAGPKVAPATVIGTLTEPLWDYGRDQGGCLIGGYVYRGSLLPELTGKYIFADNVSGRIFGVTANADETLQSVEYLANMPAGSVYTGTTSCGLDANGEIYFLKFDSATDPFPGHIYHLVRQTAGAPEPPALLSQTGAFTNLAALTPAAGLIPYEVNTPLWSDNASKHRWLGVPNDGTANTAAEQIGFASNGEWSFPSGTVFVKHFELPIDDTNPALTSRLETRFLIIDQNGGSYGVTYRWRNDGLEADLLTTSATRDFTIATAGGGTRPQTWTFPSRVDCTSCHNPNAKNVLGVKTHQLNRDAVYPTTGRTDNQLRTLAHLGLLSGGGFSEAQIASYPKVRAMSDSTASLELRARSYLDANCSQCHRPGGVRANFDARFPSSIEQQNLIYGVPNDTINGATDRYIRPQDLKHSLIYERASRVGALQMPPLAKSVADTAAMQVIAAWINSLTPAPALILSRLPATNSVFTAGPFGVRAQFTETVAGLTSGMFATANSVVADLSGSGATYDFTVQPQLEGAVAVQLPANSVQGNYASNTLAATYDAFASGLETWLTFDEGSGLTATDLSGFGNNGTLQNMDATNWIPGANGTALSFNGTDEYVAIANQTGLDYTLSCWIRTTQTFQRVDPTYSGTGILWSDVSGSASDFILGATRSAAGVNRLSFFTGPTEVSLSGTVAINTGNWVHIAATRNGTSGQMKIYVNGALNGTATGSPGLLHANSFINIGGNTGDNRYFNGSIDDVRIYSSVLGDTEVAALATRTAPREDYATWAARTMASLPAAQRVAAADGDGDGIVNFSEFAFWLDPLHADTQPHQFVRGTDGALRLIFRRRLYAGDLGYVIYLSADLQTWFPAGSDLLLESIVRPAGESYETVTMRFQSTDPILQNHAFVKIEAQNNTP